MDISMGMRYYPLFLDLSHAKCLVVGAGAVGRRKISDLLACEPSHILVLDPAINEEEFLRSFPGMDTTPLEPEKRAFLPEDIADKTLVFAATPSPCVNSLIASLCRKEHILCNVAGPLENGETGSFLVPAHLENGPLALALSTSGCSPALARMLKEELKAWLGNGYAHLALLLKALRPHLLSLHLGSEADAALFRSLCARPLRDKLLSALASGNKSEVAALLRTVLPQELFPSIEEILHELD